MCRALSLLYASSALFSVSDCPARPVYTCCYEIDLGFYRTVLLKATEAKSNITTRVTPSTNAPRLFVISHIGATQAREPARVQSAEWRGQTIRPDAAASHPRSSSHILRLESQLGLLPGG